MSRPAQRRLLASLPVIAVGAYFLGGVLVPLLDALDLHGAAAFFVNLYGHTCHQIPDRTMLIGDAALGFCARCSGFYGALFAVSAAALINRRIRAPLALMLIMQIPIAVDVLFDLSAYAASANLWRCLTGAIGGGGLALWAYPWYRRKLDEQLADSPAKS